MCFYEYRRVLCYCIKKIKCEELIWSGPQKVLPNFDYLVMSFHVKLWNISTGALSSDKSRIVGKLSVTLFKIKKKITVILQTKNSNSAIFLLKVCSTWSMNQSPGVLTFHPSNLKFLHSISNSTFPLSLVLRSELPYK